MPHSKFPSQKDTCPSCLKRGNKFVGGHLIIEDHVYIVPVCENCNNTYKGEKAEHHFFYVNELDMVPVPEP